MEGFEGAGTTDLRMEAYIERKYASYHTTYTEAATGRYGGRALEVYGSSFFRVAIDNKTTFIVGFAFKCEDYNDNEDLLRLYDGGTVQMQISTRATGDLRVERGTTELDTTVGLGLAINVWYYIELKVTIDNAAGAYELRVNEVNVLSDTAVDTQESANASVSDIMFYGDPTSSVDSFYFDDIYVIDTVGARNNDFLGNMKITAIYPDADTAEEDFTPQAAGDNYAEVDDGVTIDDATYNDGTTAGEQDVFGYDNTSSIKTIAGIQISTEAKESDATLFDMKTLVRTDSTINADAAQAQSSSFTVTTRILEQDPNSSIDWTAAGLDAAEFGYEVG